jgi:hypothetical protein
VTQQPKQPSIFQLHAPGRTSQHFFEPGELPKSLFVALAQPTPPTDGDPLPQAQATILQLVRLDLFRGKPYEDDLLATAGLPPRNKAAAGQNKKETQ